MPEALNENHELLVVVGELDDSTERIVNYLADEYGVAVNAVFFRFFRDGENEYLSRVWRIDLGEAEAKVIEKRGREPWNGAFYVSFGEGYVKLFADLVTIREPEREIRVINKSAGSSSVRSTAHRGYHERGALP